MTERRTKIITGIAAALAFALLLFAVLPTDAKAFSEAEAGRRFAIELWELVNDARRQAGVPPLTLDFALCAPTRMRAEECLSADMRTRETAHLRPDGRAFYTILDETGFTDWSAAHENLAYTSSLMFSAQRTFEAWMASDSGHREAILDPAMKTMGAGVFRAAERCTVAGILYPDGCLFSCLLFTDGTAKEPYIPQGPSNDSELFLLRSPALPARRGRGLYPSTR